MPPKRRPDTTSDGGPPIQTVTEPPTEPATQPTTAPPAAEPCPDAAGCVLPKGHNMGQADVPANHPTLDAILAKIREKYGASLSLLDDDPVVFQRRLSALAVPQPGAVFGAFWNVMKDVQGVGKHGEMARSAGGYQFRRYDDLKRELGAACRRHGLGLQSRLMSHTHDRVGDMNVAVVEMMFRFTSLVDGTEMTFEAVGEGRDRGDKATGKAHTMALKTCLDQAFMLAAEDIEDPDATRPDLGTVSAETHARSQRETLDQMTRESQGMPEPDGFPNTRPDPTPAAGDPWDMGAPPTPGDATAEEQARAALTAAQQPGVDHDRWNAITEHARKLNLLRVEIDGVPLQRHLVGVARTLAKS